jgi:hypothetical protein
MFLLPMVTGHLGAGEIPGTLSLCEDQRAGFPTPRKCRLFGIIIVTGHDVTSQTAHENSIFALITSISIFLRTFFRPIFYQ